MFTEQRALYVIFNFTNKIGSVIFFHNTPLYVRTPNDVPEGVRMITRGDCIWNFGAKNRNILTFRSKTGIRLQTLASQLLVI